MKKVSIFSCAVFLLFGLNMVVVNSAIGYGAGLSQLDAGNSALQILTDYGASPDGLYWIDPNGAGTEDAFFSYADMTHNGGGWSGVQHDSMSADAPGWAVDILLTHSTSMSHAAIMVYDGSDKITGDLYNADGGAWANAYILSSDEDALDDILWPDLLEAYSNTFILADSSAAYPSATVPIPGAVWLLGTGLIGILGIRRRTKN